MKILIIGNRGIQHALAVRLESEGCTVHVYPGQKNPIYTSVNYEQAIVNEYDLAIVGSARYFDHPIVSNLKSRETAIFGPDKNASLLETSKIKFKEFADFACIKTPGARAFSEINSALEYIRDRTGPFVIKANGPARGCGVTIATTFDEAKIDLEHKLRDVNNPYYAGEVLIEEFISGIEVAVNIFMDGKNFHVLPPTKPHKRRFDGDKGPLVAGMGSIASVPLNNFFYSELETLIIRRTLDAIKVKGWDFRGCLFVNLMLTETEIYVLEYNCRMGDPAMLVDLMLLRSSLSNLLEKTVNQKLVDYKAEISEDTSCAITLCSNNYPNDQEFGQEFDISNLPILRPNMDSGIVIAGAEIADDSKFLRITNGVVLSAISTNKDRDLAKQEAHKLAKLVPFLDIRTDIGNAFLIPKRWAR